MNYCEEYINELKSLNIKEMKDLNDKTICLSGATGLIGSYLIDALLVNDINVKVIALVRNKEKAEERFSKFKDDSRLVIQVADLQKNIEVDGDVDYVIHAASLTDPLGYSLYPVETMTTNILGVKNMLDIAVSKKAKFSFLSSCEVYGKNESINIKENEYGYVNILETRSCYNESKRASETLCVSYAQEYGVEVCMLRLSRIYGPTMKISDTKALSQFIKNGLKKENIVLKSKGTQLFNYTYVADIVDAMIKTLVKKNKEFAYNVSSDELISLRDIAKHIADTSGTEVIFDLPSETEAKGYSKSLVSSLDSSKIKAEFAWESKVTLFQGIDSTLKILNKIY